MSKNTVFTGKRIFQYNIVIYLLLLGLETFNNILFSISGAKTGKVLSSLYGDASGIFRLIFFDLILYLVAIVSIYLAFAWMNARIIQKVLAKVEVLLRKKINDYSAAAIFVLVNGLFILSSYCFIAFLYPSSRHDIIGLSSVPAFSISTVIFIVFAAVYFLSVLIKKLLV